MLNKIIKNKVKLSKYIRPKLINLSKEEIAKIHANGKMTLQEKLIELEKMDRCIFSNNINQEKNRCKKYYRCRDCLIDYLNKEMDDKQASKKLVKTKYRKK